MANEGNVVCVVTFNVTARNIELVVGQARNLLQNTAPTVQGFIEGVLLTGEDRTQVILLTHWESRDAWARGEWNEQVARGVAKLYEETASYTVRLFMEDAQSASRQAT